MIPTQLQSYVGGRFVGARAGVPLASAIDGHTVAHAHADELETGALEVGLDDLGVDAVQFGDRPAGVAIGQSDMVDDADDGAGLGHKPRDIYVEDMRVGEPASTEPGIRIRARDFR